MNKLKLSIILALIILMAGIESRAANEECVNSVYTNEIITKTQAQFRPIAVMMPTDKDAQPSYGISNADILYEIMEEGNISRQMAIISDWTELEKIGNIRSCRLYYIPQATEWDAILIHFGGVVYMKDRITCDDINNLSGTFEYGAGGDAPGASYFFRSVDKKAPHNAYISGNNIVKASNELGYSLNLRSEYYNEKHFTFSDTTNDLSQYGDEATNASSVNLSAIFPYTQSAFYYNEAEGVYYKTIHNNPQIDGLTKTQIKFTNIIIQNTKWCYYPDNKYLYFQNIDDTETGYFITKGKCIPITWKKTSDYSPTVYYDTKGNEIQLNTGKTYIAIAQKGRVPTIE